MNIYKGNLKKKKNMFAFGYFSIFIYFLLPKTIFLKGSFFPSLSTPSIIWSNMERRAPEDVAPPLNPRCPGFAGAELQGTAFKEQRSDSSDEFCPRPFSD